MTVGLAPPPDFAMLNPDCFGSGSIMGKDRLTAFSDGVIAIIITIMVLELKVPDGADWAALQQVAPVFVSYVLSFVYLAIYWNNHHHLLHTVTQVDGLILWANSHLLFWLSLVPASTWWLGQHFPAPLPTAVYGVTLLLPAIAYFLLQRPSCTAMGRLPFWPARSAAISRARPLLRFTSQASRSAFSCHGYRSRSTC